MTILPSSIPDTSVITGCVRVALDNAEADRGDAPPTSAAAREKIGKLLDFSEAYLPGHVLTEIPECDVYAMIDLLLTDCTEIDIPPEYADRVEVVWRKSAGKSAGAVVLGTCKPIGKRERQTYRGEGPSPWWRLTLALDVWILLTTEERWRLVHHELMHATVKEDAEGAIVGPSGRPHDIEDFAATVARYGLGSELQARFVAQTMARPKIAEEMRRTWQVDPVTGQGLLFAPNIPAVGR